MGYIIDISKYQKTEEINWSVFSKGIDLLIARLQYGDSKDSYYDEHIANAKKFNIPVNSYVFPSFNSVADAKYEASIAAKNHAKDSEVIWVDIESEYDKYMRPKGITKLTKNARLDGIKAYVTELRRKGERKVGAYIAHNVYEPWGLDSIIGIFDKIWIPRYGKNDAQLHTKPNYPYDLWQFTSMGKKDGYIGDGGLDMSILADPKTLGWFTGKEKEDLTPYKVIVPNTDYHQARNLVIEYKTKGYNCYGHNLKKYTSSQKPADSDPYMFIVETTHDKAVKLVIELQTKGYKKTYGTKIK